jgi:nitrite reductase/ring-hydroxylating ferredoxin subunit
MKPTGWFQVAWSPEIGPGEIKNLSYLGRELVAFRTRSGHLVVLDAHCAHLGAHLGHGGSVRGEHIVCPFHGWEWDGQGRNVLIPYQDHPNKARCVRSWDVSEKNEAVFVWHDLDGRPPLYPVPDVFTDLFDDGASADDYYRSYPEASLRIEHVTVHPQSVMENSVDFAHFQFVHRANEMPRFTEMTADEWHFKTTFEMTLGGGKAATVLTPDGPVEGGLNALNCGISIGFIRQFGPDNQRTMVNATPVDDQVSDLFFTNWLSRLPGDGPVVPDSLTRRLKLVENQFLADVRIWEHQRYTDPAGLAASEVRGFTALRRWAKRFYPTVGDGGSQKRVQ